MKKLLVLASTLVLPACVVDPYYPNYGYAGAAYPAYGYTNPAVPALVGAAAGAAIGYGLGQAYAPAYYRRPYYAPYRYYHRPPPYYRGW